MRTAVTCTATLTEAAAAAPQLEVTAACKFELQFEPTFKCTPTI